MNPISLNLNALQPLGPASPELIAPTSHSQGDKFGNAFASMLQETMSAEMSAQQAIETGISGGDITQAEMMSALKKADLSIRMLMQIRNKMLDAYNELQQMRF